MAAASLCIDTEKIDSQLSDSSPPQPSLEQERCHRPNASPAMTAIKNVDTSRSPADSSPEYPPDSANVLSTIKTSIYLNQSTAAPAVKNTSKPQFPADAPLGCPHILHHENLNDPTYENIHIADLVITLLTKTRGIATDASLMLDKKCCFCVKISRFRRDTRSDLLIVRHDRVIKIGYGYVRGDFAQEWQTQHVYLMGEQISDKWSLVSSWSRVSNREDMEEDVVLEPGIAFASNFLAAMALLAEGAA